MNIICKARRVMFAAFLTVFATVMNCYEPAFAATPPAAVKNLSAWWDASNTTSLNVGSLSNSVSQWNDKSGNNENLVSPNFGTQPTYIASGINSLPSISFNGTSQYMTSVDTTYSRLLYPESTVFIVEYSPNDSQNAFTMYSGISDNQRYALQIPVVNNFFFDFGSDNLGSPANRLNVAAGATGNHIYTAVGGITAPTQALRKDGAQIASRSPSASVAFNCAVGIGAGISCAGGSPGTYLNGYISEIIVYNKNLSNANYQLIEGVLACKYALQGSLPGAHPYKSTCPAGSESSILTGITGLASWHDATDASTVITTSTAITVQMLDKSGNAYTLGQGNSNNRPYYVASCSGVFGCLQFGGFSSTKYLQSLDTLLSRIVVPTSSVFFVQIPNSQTQNTALLFTGNTVNARYNFSVPQGPGIFRVDVGTDTGNNMSASGITVTGMHIWEAVATAPGSGNGYKDGNLIASRTLGSYTGFGCTIFLGTNAVCGSAVGGFDYAGKFFEMLVYNRALTTPERYYVEGYLACKYSLQANLPAGHPYAVACPLTANPSLTHVLTVSPTGNQVPGTALTYTEAYTAAQSVVYNTVLTLPLDPNVYFKIGSASSAPGSTGVTAAITYSNDNGATYTYTPVSGAGGAPSTYDGLVTHIRFTLSGGVVSGTGVNSGTVSAITRIK